MNDKKVLVIAGPTASGKTGLGIELAQIIDGEVISADSAQVYRYMNIGTAKPTLDEMCGIPHHMIDVIEPDEDFSVALYKSMAEACIEEILSRGKVPIVVGGTGLYINALVYNIQFSETICDWSFREEMRVLSEDKGALFLHERLMEVDPISAQRIHPNNVKRVIRALEVFETTKKPLSEHQIESRKEEPKYGYRIFGLQVERNRLYERIDKRVDLMIDMGLEKEVRALLAKGFNRELVSFQAIGYKEMIAAIQGEYTMEEAIEKLKLGTRHLAKRQVTWFKNVEGLIWMDMDKLERRAMLKILADALNNKA